MIRCKAKRYSSCMVMLSLCVMLTIPLWASTAIGSLRRPESTQNVEKEPARQIVEKFMNAMMSQDQTILKSLLSPQWQRENSINLDDFFVDTYYPDFFDIKEVKSNGDVICIIGGDTWKHRLTFRTVSENQGHFILPSEYFKDGDIGNYIEPWWKVEANFDQ